MRQKWFSEKRSDKNKDSLKNELVSKGFLRDFSGIVPET